MLFGVFMQVMDENAQISRTCPSISDHDLVVSASPGLKHRIGVIGERGSFDGDLKELQYIQNKILATGAVKTNRYKPAGRQKEIGHGGGSEQGQFVSFYESVRHGKPVAVDGRAGMLAIAVGQAAEKKRPKTPACGDSTRAAVFYTKLSSPVNARAKD